MKAINVIYLISGISTAAMVATVAINDRRLRDYEAQIGVSIGSDEETDTPPSQVVSNYKGRMPFMTRSQQSNLLKASLVPLVIGVGFLGIDLFDEMVRMTKK